MENQTLKPVKISCGYRAKSSANFQSEEYSIGLEMDVLINGKTEEVQQKADLLYALCKQIVNKQRGISVDSLLTPPAQSETKPETKSEANPEAPAQAPAAPQQSNGNGVISPKQVKYIFALGRTKNMFGKAVRDLVFDRFKKPVEEISRHNASVLIDELKQAA